ncbi:MAG: glycerate kinase type-2 family protein [Anaerolineales bacterium]
MTVPRFSDRETHLAALRHAALRAVDPYSAVKGHLSAEDIAPFERVFVVGAGKAGVGMARAAVEVVGDKLTGGVMAVPTVPVAPSPITFVEGGHPLPTEGSLAAGRAIAELLTQTTPRDLVIALISGGGSALMELPRPGLTLTDLQITNRQLLQCGATIHEFNTVRKALSQIKGGGLLRLAHPAHVLALILSDVVGNDLAIIASGPTEAGSGWGTEAVDGPYRMSARAIVEQYQLQAGLPQAVVATLQRESLTSVPSSVQSVDNRLMASNRIAGEAAAEAARELGFEAEFLGDDWQGEAREAGRRFVRVMQASPLHRPFCLIAGGESTVTLRGLGKGGRNQEAALAAAIAIDGQPNVAISTFGTDGIDGPTDSAGATATGETVAQAYALGLHPQNCLEDNDSYTFFKALGDLIITGPTGTNVNDLMFGLAY